MPAYRERLHVPASWWLIAGAGVLVFGSELFAGFSFTVGVIVYIVLAAICAAFLLIWGGAEISVAGGELRAAQTRVPLSLVTETQPLDEAQTRAMCGPRADPTAWLLIRPSVKQSVFVRLGGSTVQRRKRIRLSMSLLPVAVVTESHVSRWPYLLICTRRPAELAAAIERSRAALVAAD